MKKSTKMIQGLKDETQGAKFIQSRKEIVQLKRHQYIYAFIRAMSFCTIKSLGIG